MKPKKQNRKDSFQSSDGGFSDGSSKQFSVNKKKGDAENSQQVNKSEELDPQEAQLQDITFFNENLPPSQPIVVKDYSLEADMIFGWSPKIQFQGPVPMTFDNTMVDIIISHLNSPTQNKTPYKLVYLGFRPLNTLKLHSAFCDNSREDSYYFKFNSLYGNSRMNGFFHSLEKKNKNKFVMPFLGMNPSLSTNNKENNNQNTMKFYEQNDETNQNTQETFGLTQGIQINLKTPQSNLNKNDKQFTLFLTEDNRENNKTLIFDSYFESGNLDCVVQVAQNEYDLFMRVDSNTKGHLQWYYFKVKGAQTSQRVKFNICNFSKNKSLYMRGMKPYIYSQKENSLFKSDWSQQGEKVTYQLKEFRYPFIKEYIDELKPKLYYQLSFEYVFKYSDDVVSIAYCPPYTFSYLTTFLRELSTIHKLQNGNFLKEEKLSSSMSGLDVPLLTITDFNQSEEEINKRKAIVISARIHPGESNGSYLMHGFLKYIFTDEADEIRKKCIFKIVPMLNPDGVVLGNYRTGIAGRDLNRVFANPDKMLYPTVIGLKELVSIAKKQYGQNLIMFLDLHGHSVKKNVFTYGPDYPIFDLNYYQCRLFSKILAKMTDMFRYFSCIFRISQMKKNTARGIFFNNYDIGNCFTVEASNGSYYIGNQKTIDFTINDWLSMGEQIVKGINEYIQTIIDYDLTQQAKLQQKKLEREQKIQDEQSFQTSTQATTAGSRSDNSGFITQRAFIQKSIIEEVTPASLIKIRNDRFSQKFQSDSENEGILSYLSKTNAQPDKKKKAQYQNKNKMNFKIQKINQKSINFNKQFLLEESPFSKYFSKNAEEEEKQKQNDAESDGFSEGGSDSESEGEDYDKAFLKNFQATVQRDFQLFNKIFENLENFDVKTEQTLIKRNNPDKLKEEYLNDKINYQLIQKKNELNQLGLNKIDNSIRYSYNNQSALTPTHFKTPVIMPKTNDKSLKIEFQQVPSSQRNTPQKKQHIVGNSQLGLDIFKDRNNQKKYQSRSQLKDSSNLLNSQIAFLNSSEQKKMIKDHINYDKYDDLYSQEFTQIEQAQYLNPISQRNGRYNSATPFKEDNLNIINLFHRANNTPLVQTTDNQSLMRIINKIKDGEKQGNDLEEVQGKRVLILTNNSYFNNLNENNNISSKNLNQNVNQSFNQIRTNSLAANRAVVDSSQLNYKKQAFSFQNQQIPSQVHLKSILNTTLFSNLAQIKEKTQNQIIPPKNFYQQNANMNQGPSPKRHLSQSYQQFLQQQQAKQDEYSPAKPLQNQQVDSYYLTSNGFGFKENKDESIQLMTGLSKKREIQNHINNNQNGHLYNTFHNKFNSANNSPIQSLSPIKNSYNSANYSFYRRVSYQPHQNTSANYQNNQLNTANPNSTNSFINISPRESSNKKMKYPSAFYKIKKHFTSKKKNEEQQKQTNGYNPNVCYQQQYQAQI
ncbi:hypothetical protein ABPG72_022688 [Tetrahymena utriculariae]